MLPFLGISAGLGLVGNLFKTGLGVAQYLKGSRMNPIRPTYDIPPEVRQQLALQQSNLNARSAGAARAEANIGQNQAAALGNIRQGATSSSQLLASAGLAQANSNAAYRNLASQEQDDYQRRLQGLMAAQNNMANYRDKEFQLNQYEPYMNDTATKSALTQGGLTNFYNGLMDTGNMVGKYGLAQQYGYWPQQGQQGLQQNGIDYFRNRFSPGGFQQGQMGLGGLMNSYGR